jgi:hypothetical protein
MINANEKPLGFSIARRSTRRLVVIGCAALMGGGIYALLIRQNFRGLGIFGPLLYLIPLMLGGVRRDGLVKPFQSSPSELGFFRRRNQGLDEREIVERDRIHFLAHNITRWLAAVLFFAFTYCVQLCPAALAQIGTTFLFVIALSLWSLPQCMILWTEPDLEPDAQK